MDQVNPKNKVLANQPGQERIERAQESVRRKVFKHRKKQGQNVDDVVDIPTNPTDEDIMAVIMQNVGDEFEKNGKVAEPYKGTIEEILSPTTIKTEEIFTESQLDPALWKTFEVQVPTKEFVEVPGIDNLEKDLRYTTTLSNGNKTITFPSGSSGYSGTRLGFFRNTIES